MKMPKRSLVMVRSDQNGCPWADGVSDDALVAVTPVADDPLGTTAAGGGGRPRGNDGCGQAATRGLGGSAGVLGSTGSASVRLAARPARHTRARRRRAA